MKTNQTLTIIKPTAIRQNYHGDILARIVTAGFEIKALKMVHMSRSRAESFYQVHAQKPFFNDLTQFMSSGPVIVAILEKENAVETYRKFIGATRPEEASRGTIRNLYGTSITKNAVHGSDSNENAQIESDFFFSRLERFEMH